MNNDNPFDKKLKATTHMPPGFRDAIIDITDTLDFCWAAAQAVFETAARPEHALALLPQFLTRADAERQRQAAPPPTPTDDDTTAPAKKVRSRPKA
jgi:hypothetical protein